MREISINCRITLFGDSGYSIISNDLSKECIDYLNPNNQLCFPYNKRSITIDDADSSTVQDLYNKALKAFEIPYNPTSELGPLADFAFHIGNTIVTITNPDIILSELINIFNTDEIELFVVFTLGKGELFREAGFRFYMNSHEGNRHNRPHVHVSTNDGRSGSIDIQTLEQNRGGKIKSKEMKKIVTILKGKQRDLLEAWNYSTDGIVVDIDYMLGLIQIEEDN